MKTAIDAIDEIVQVVLSLNLPITGNVYRLVRPDNSNLEDIVIGTVAMSASQEQTGVFNVNIHVPVLRLGYVYLPNWERLRELSELVSGGLLSYYGYDYNFLTEEPFTPIPDGNNWYGNIRLRYYSKR